MVRPNTKKRRMQRVAKMLMLSNRVLRMTADEMEKVISEALPLGYALENPETVGKVRVMNMPTPFVGTRREKKTSDDYRREWGGGWPQT